jgi:hypothetical protein
LAGIGLAQPVAEVRALAERLIAFVEADEPITLDEALSLAPERGEPHWRAARARDERNRLLRLAALAHFPGQAPSQAGKRLAAEWGKYLCERQPGDRHAVECPARIRDTLSEAFWRIMTVWPGAPLGPKQISEVLRSAEPIAIEYSSGPQNCSSQPSRKQRTSARPARMAADELDHR